MYKKADFATSKTPAPKADRIKGSKKNPAGSAKSSSSASKISLSKSTISVLRKKLEDFRKKYPKKKNVSENDLKAVYRRGSGAYSSTHRPTISGGKPNSRAAWSYARVNAFLRKAAGVEAKKAYIQDDDLLKKGGQINPDEFALVVYHEKSGNWMVQQNKVYVWLYEDLDAAKKLQNDEYDWVMFPPTASISMAFRRGYVPPLKQIWTKKYQKEHRGSDKLVGIVEGWYDEKNNKLYVLMMTTRKDYRRRGVNSYLITFLRQKFGLEKDQVIFDKPTDEGKLFEASGKYHLGGEMSKHLAPNGKPSNLTHEQWHMVRTPEFKAWFGDWENDPENASKVVDENGEPLVVYHGSNVPNINIFKESYDGGYWFTSKYEVAEDFAENNNLFGKKNIYIVFLNIKNPYINNLKGSFLEHSKDTFDTIREVVDGIDGIILKNALDYVENPIISDIYNCFEPNQIKLADGTNTTFDGSNPDIRYAEGGLVQDYLKNIVKEKTDLGEKYFADFGRDGKIIWTDWTDDAHYPTIYIDRIDRYKNENWKGKYRFSETNQGKKDSKGEGALAIASLFMKYPQIDFITYNNASINEDGSSFWSRIGGDDSYLFRENFFDYFSKKYAGRLGITFDGSNPDIRYAEGGTTQAMLKPTKTVEQIATEFAVPKYFVERQLQNGIRVELEHTNDKQVAEKIALHHLAETPEYYIKLSKMESQIEYKKGGKTDNAITIEPKPNDTKPALISVVNEGNDYGFSTPTGEKTRLTYLQQVLVRTKGFKDFFGDWEAAAKAFLADGRNNFIEHYKNISKVLDYNTLEPKVVYHGTRAEDEFFRFDVTKEKGMGRPYGYFAVNRQYSDRFTQFSQRSTRQTKPLLYTCFLNVRNPFMANGSDYWQKNRDEGGWLTTIIGSMTWERYKTIENNATTKPLADAIESQIGKYLQQSFGGEKKPFWINMAKDIEKDFKFFLMAYGYDGIIYGEEISTPYNPDDPSQYTEAVTIFDSKQVKLADGRNLNFNPLIDDIRYKRGGEVEEAKKDSDETHELHQRNPFGVMDKKAKLGMLINGKKYAEGGKIVHEDGITNDGKKGGYFDGRSHADGGIKAINVDTGQLIEVEGEEVIITKGAVNDETKREFEGEMLTNREILSRINQSGGGVAFEDGGEVRGHVCGCSGKKYKYGGEMLEDFNIIRNMSKPIKFVDDMLQSPKRFADFLVEKMK